MFKHNNVDLITFRQALRFQYGIQALAFRSKKMRIMMVYLLVIKYRKERVIHGRQSTENKRALISRGVKG